MHLSVCNVKVIKKFNSVTLQMEVIFILLTDNRGAKKQYISENDHV